MLASSLGRPYERQEPFHCAIALAQKCLPWGHVLRQNAKTHSALEWHVSSFLSTISSVFMDNSGVLHLS